MDHFVSTPRTNYKQINMDVQSGRDTSPSQPLKTGSLTQNAPVDGLLETGYESGVDDPQSSTHQQHLGWMMCG
jgi:hypothetical protein